MVPLYFVSNEAYSGKSSICIALGKILIKRGLRVGYMKPAGTLPARIKGITVDEDAQYIKEVLEIKDELGDISPIVLTRNYYREGLRDEDFSKNFLNIIEKSYQKIRQSKDIVLLEGAKNIENGLFLGISSKEICARLKAKAILIMKYSSEIVDTVLLAKEYMGECLGGIIINWIPQNQTEYINDLILPYFAKKEITVFGCIYLDKTLSSVTIKEIADLIEGKIISAKNKVDELITSFMIGAMSEEQALSYFRKQADKAVITGGDRADVQLAALETDTKCLILTGNFQPPTVVTSRAEELGVPIVLVPFDTLTTMEKINEIMGRVRFHEFTKIDKIIEVVSSHINIDLLINLSK
ncbi:MAG: phosphotransacetylase family protein [Actinobacteria bacterium]|nr:phosphotransacetylase family protein [Actinomycetota bacterium]MCL6087846.1 phosphotransacetylase family protein [Actinomycetota bacterium]